MRSQTVSGPDGLERPSAPQPLVIEADSESVLIPGRLILDAQYSRHGGDLVLSGADGAKAVVKGFFEAERPPMLVSDAGEAIAPDLAASLARALGPTLYAQAQPASLGGTPIGQIDKLQGDVFASRPDGLRRKLAAGDPVFQGEVIETGSGGSIGIVFADRSTFALNENARMLLDQLVYDPAAKRGALKLSLLKGAFLFVSGEISKLQSEIQQASGGGEQDLVSMRTPVATIGVRGTAGGGNALGEGQNNTYTVFDGTVIVRTGSSFQVLDQPMLTTSVFSLFVAPSVPRLASRAEILSRFGDAIRILPMPPPATGDGVRSAQAGTASVVATLLASITSDQASGDAGTSTGTGALPASSSAEAVPPPANAPAFVPPAQFFADLAADPPTALAVAPIAVGSSVLPTWSVTSIAAVATAPPPPPEAPPPPTGPTIIVGTEGPDALVGVSGPTIIIAQSGDDVITGGPSADQILAGAGNDVVNASSGDDLVIGGAGDDTLAGGDGIDTVSYAEATAGVFVDLAEGRAISQASDGLDTLSGFENVIGSNFGDTIQGDDNTNVLIGGGGNDFVSGHGGDDLIDGGAGNDSIEGDAGDDLLIGGAGNDEIFGGTGGDVLLGGAGRDTIAGGTGSDTFVYVETSDGFEKPTNGPASGSEAFDVITDFQTGQDQFVFDAPAFGNLPEGPLAAGVNFSVIGTGYDGTSSGGANAAWQAGAPSFIFDAANNRLIYDANGAADGYTVVAQVQPGATVAASDVKIAGGAPET